VVGRGLDVSTLWRLSDQRASCVTGAALPYWGSDLNLAASKERQNGCGLGRQAWILDARPQSGGLNPEGARIPDLRSG